ncbi:MAG: porin [Cytophagales bacterium]|nr:MAG: porin [Cytophagales bacterium]
MRKIFRYVLLLSLFAVLHFSATAQAVVDSTAKAEPAAGFKFSGYLDTYYFMNMNNPSSRSNLGASGISRGFDRNPGQFQLGMLMTRMSYSNKWAEVVGEVGWGPNAEYGSYGNDFRYKWGSVLANNTISALFIKQAYINLKATDKLTFTMGQFGTHIGYEYIDAPLNFHYSINNTFNAGIPFYHTGLKATYAFSDKVSLMAGVVNGTDGVNDNNRGKSFIGQLFVSPAEGLNVYFNTIQGNEANARTTGKDTTSWFGVLDLVATYQISEKLMLGTWLMYGSLKGEFQGSGYAAETKNWGGANLYATYKFSDLFTFGTRIEYFDNTSGARALLTNGAGTDVMTYTFTGNFSLAGGALTLKPEFRIDNFKKIGGVGNEEVQQFMDSDGKFTKSSQATIGMAAIFKF